MNKSVLKGIVVTLLILICLGAAFLAGTKLNGGKKSAGSLEGKGYASGEEAMQAFAEAFASKDIDAMYATCALDSYVDHIDYEEMMEQYGAYIPTQKFLSGSDETSRKINLELRKNELSNLFYYMYLHIGTAEDSKVMDLMTLSLKQNDPDEILDALKGPEAVETITLDKVVPAKKYGSTSGMKKGQKSFAKVFGGEIESYAARLDIDGEDWVLFADVIEYDDKWYVLRPHGFGGSVMGLPVNYGGLVREDAIDN